MREKQKGVFMKYILRKADGSPIDEQACYFVLRLDTDKAARHAMLTYAGHILNRELAADIVKCVDWLNDPPRCTCAGRNDGITICPLHDSLFDPVWRYGEDGITALEAENKRLREAVDEVLPILDDAISTKHPNMLVPREIDSPEQVDVVGVPAYCANILRKALKGEESRDPFVGAASKRDRDWILAIHEGLRCAGIISPDEVIEMPIVPKQELFEQFFRDIAREALEGKKK